jgi:hypothetical protein
MLDSCLGPGTFRVRKMLDLQKKYAIISNIFQVQHRQAIFTLVLIIWMLDLRLKSISNEIY